MNLASENTGVVILVSKEDDTPSLTTGGPGTLTSMCNQAPNLVKCYAGDGNQSGLTFVHGWSDHLEHPQRRRSETSHIVDVNCATDDKSAPYFLLTGDCSLGARVTIDFGFAGDPRPDPPTGIKAVVTLKAPGCGTRAAQWGTKARSGTESTWYAPGPFVDPAIGRTTFSIEWQTESPAGRRS